MTVSMHSASVPIFVRMLGSMLAWLDKAEAHAVARKFDANNFVGMRLTPDMLPFARQIQIATDACKGALSRLADEEAPKWADDEVTLEQLRGRIRKAIDYARSFDPGKLDGSETREIALPVPGAPRLSGEVFLKQFALPNFFFHVTMTYALLRQGGVELGKRDYLGAP